MKSYSKELATKTEVEQTVSELTTKVEKLREMNYYSFMLHLLEVTIIVILILLSQI